MTIRLPKVRRVIPPRQQFKPTHKAPSLCEAHKNLLLPGTLKPCSSGGTYQIDGFYLCPMHAGQIALAVLIAHSAEGATRETGETAQGRETVGSSSGERCDEEKV